MASTISLTEVQSNGGGGGGGSNKDLRHNAPSVTGKTENGDTTNFYLPGTAQEKGLTSRIDVRLCS